MAIPQRHLLIQHDIDLHIELVTRMISLAPLDRLDALREPHCQIQQDIAVLGRRGRTGEVTDVRRGGAGPVEDHIQRQSEPAQGVEPPELGIVADDGEDDGEGVEDDIGHRVLRQGLHGAVPDQPAVQPAAQLDDDGQRHNDDAGDAELHDGVIGAAAGEPVDAFDEDLEEGDDHDDAEDEHADGLEAPPADGVGILVLALDELRGRPDDGRGEEIERCVHEGGEDGEGGGEDDDGDLAGQKEGVGGEVDVDGEGHDGAAAVGVVIVAQLQFYRFRVVGGAVAEQRGILVHVGQFVERFRGALDFDLGRGAVLAGVSLQTGRGMLLIL